VTRKFCVLLVDDDYNDRLLFESAFGQSGLHGQLFEANDGVAAIDYLLGQGLYDDRIKFPFPDVVFLDLKMPGMDGFAVLKQIRLTAALKDLPVMVLSNSRLESDVKTAYALGANAVHQKPSRFLDFVNLLRTLLTPWHRVYFGDTSRKSSESSR